MVIPISDPDGQKHFSEEKGIEILSSDDPDGDGIVNLMDGYEFTLEDGLQNNPIATFRGIEEIYLVVFIDPSELPDEIATNSANSRS